MLIPEVKEVKVIDSLIDSNIAAGNLRPKTIVVITLQMSKISLKGNQIPLLGLSCLKSDRPPIDLGFQKVNGAIIPRFKNNPRFFCYKSHLVIVVGDDNHMLFVSKKRVMKFEFLSYPFNEREVTDKKIVDFIDSYEYRDGKFVSEAIKIN